MEIFSIMNFLYMWKITFSWQFRILEMGKEIKSFQFKAHVLKSNIFNQYRARVLYGWYHCSVQRQGVIENDCSHGAMAAPASLQREREMHTWLMKVSALEDRTVIFPFSSVHSENNVPFLLLTLHIFCFFFFFFLADLYFPCGWWRAIWLMQEDFKKCFIMFTNKCAA